MAAQFRYSSQMLMPSTMGPCICSSLAHIPVNRSYKLGTYNTASPIITGSQASSCACSVGLPG